MKDTRTLAERLSNDARIRELEQIIPRQVITIRRILDPTKPFPVDYSKQMLYLEEILLEYKERTGKEYMQPRPDLLNRKYGVGA